MTVTQANCITGAVTADGDATANGGGVTYTKVPADPYVPGDAVTVTAKLSDGYTWVVPLPAVDRRYPAATRSAFHVTLNAAATC